MLAWILAPPLASAQSVLTFAREIAPGDLQNVGIAIANPADTDAPVTFELRDPAGSLVGSSEAVVKARGQLARLAREIFNELRGGGWIRAVSPVPGLRGLWLGGNFRTFMDGAQTAPSGLDLILPLVTAKSEITLINTSESEAIVLVRLFGTAGLEVAEPIVRILPAMGSFRSSAAVLFNPVDWSAASHARVTSSAPVAGAAEVSDFQTAPSLEVINATNATGGALDLVFPFVAWGRFVSSDYNTVIGLTSAGTSPQEVVLTFTPFDGGTGRVTQRTLAPNSGLRATVRNLFGFDNSFRKGWVRVTGTQALIGFTSVADLTLQSAATSAGMSAAATGLIFGHIADLPPWLTALALVNPGTTAATVEVFAIAGDGTLIGGANETATARFVLSPGEQRTRFLYEWIPQTQSRRTDGGFIFVRSNRPIYGMEFFFTRSFEVMSDVSGFGLSGTFTPPAP